MKFSIISGVAAVAVVLGTVGAMAQTTGSSTLTPPPAGYNNSTVGPASADQSSATHYKTSTDGYNNSTVGPASADKSQSSQGGQPPPAGYNNSTIGPAGADKSQSAQYTTPAKSQ